ncbi:hypothetical protein RYX36_006203 [Vicia faba]
MEPTTSLSPPPLGLLPPPLQSISFLLCHHCSVPPSFHFRRTTTMAPRGRPPKKTAGNTRMDAAMDAMRQFGFKKKLVWKTVEELLDVYEGTQGWPFIEEGSYKLLLESLLYNQQTCVDDKDDTRRDDVGEISSAATLKTGMTEVGSSGLVAHDSLSRASDDLNSTSQTNDHHQDSAPIINQEIEADEKDTNVATKRVEDQKGISVKSK